MARFKEYTAEEIVLGTAKFSWPFEIRVWRNLEQCLQRLYIGYEAVSIKLLTSTEEHLFDSMFESLKLIRHPQILSILGFCSELKCFVYEHIDNSRSLHEVIKQKLLWHDRVRIAGDILAAFSYVKKTRYGVCRPIVPDYPNASNILIDHKSNAKVNLVLKRCNTLPDFACDVKTFGYLVLNLLTGMPGNFISYCYVRYVGLLQALDKTAGQWPLDLAEKFINVCRCCVDCNPTDDLRKKYIMVWIVKEMNEIREQADEIVKGCAGTHDQNSDNVAADGLHHPKIV